MAKYTINGQEIYAREEGPPNAQIALLIHGWSSSWYALSPLLPLLRYRFSCIAIDLPGYGNSPAPKHRISIPYYADLIAELIREVSDKPVVLVGHSMGGMISLTVALRHPVLVERMVLLCPTISGHLSTSINMFVSPITYLERFPVTNIITSHLERHFLNITDQLMRPVSFAERTGITELDYKRIRADARRPGQGRVRAECYTAMRQGDLRGKLSDIETPALVLWGAEDNTVPLRDAGVIADEYQHAADLRIIPKAGHWPQFEMPDVTKRFIASYLGVPAITDRLDAIPSPTAQVSIIAQFFAHSDVGNGLSLAQRTRLAAQCHVQSHRPYETVAHTQEHGTELFIVQEGNVEVWSDPEAMSKTVGTASSESQILANLLPGQITGELALLDGGRRSASLIAGEKGATVLTLTRDQVVALCEDDPQLGNRLIWNIATTLALRLRLTNWQLHLARKELQQLKNVSEPSL